MRAALLAGFAALAAAMPAAADDKVRGLIVDNGVIRYNGMKIEPNMRKEPLPHGGFPLDQRSSSAMIFVPAAKRKVIVEMTIRYDLPKIEIRTPTP